MTAPGAGFIIQVMKTVANGHVIIATALVAGLLLCAPAAAQEGFAPYGTYRKGPPETGYGEKRPVRTVEEARKILADRFGGRDVRVGAVKEKELFFEARILDRRGRLLDLVIVDKRTGRVRSIY